MATKLNPKLVLYTLLVQTSTLPESGTSSKIFITFKGVTGYTKEALLTDKPLLEGAYDKFKMYGFDVGSLTSLYV